jgi:hypothetical protein
MKSFSPRFTIAAIFAALAIGTVACLTIGATRSAQPSSPPRTTNSDATNVTKRRSGPIHVDDHAVADDNGPFLGLGASYFTALWRCKHDRTRLESDLAFLSKQGFNYFRMLSMVGYQPSWKGREIAPVAFKNRDGQQVVAMPDYWRQLQELVDLAYDHYGLRTQITIFADAQLMPDKAARMAHMQGLLTDVVAGREHKIMLLEVANEAWQNGFPEAQGVADLREFAKYLAERTKVPVAITSNHDWPKVGTSEGFKQLYGNSSADLATWHFSRDRRTDDGWKPVYDCWELGDLKGMPPVVSNEPIGPGASVNVERDPIRLVMAAAFAYTAKLPMYVFHSEAGVVGKSRFEDTPGIGQFRHVLQLLPPDLANWKRHDGKDKAAPFTVFAGGKADRYATDVQGAQDGCIRNIGSRKADRFVCIPMGISRDGVRLQARHRLQFTAYDPLTGKTLNAATLNSGESMTLPRSSGAALILGRDLPLRAPTPDCP